MNNRLPISRYDRTGRGHWYEYWVNYCNGHPHLFTTGHYKRLQNDYGATYHHVIGQDDPPYLEFADPNMLSLFLLRYS